MTGEELEREIRHAFKAVPHPQGPEIAPHACLECLEVRQLLQPHAFDEVPETVLDYLGDSLPFLGPAGLQYYLPAYLLRVTSSLDYRWIENLVFHLAPTETDLRERGDYWSERLAVFSSEQRAAVRAFVEWLSTTSAGPSYAQELTRARQVWDDAA